MSLEKKLAMLDSLADKIEDKDISLEESIKIFEQSVDLATECMKILGDCSGKLTVLQEKVRGITDENS